MQPLEIEITAEPLSAEGGGWDSRFGAEICFFGVVRGTEDGAPIEGIEYSVYGAMAPRVLQQIGSRAHQQFGEHQAKIIHRIGFVAAAEPSLLLRVGAPHSAEAFEICRWYLAELKREAPFWKHIVKSPVIA